MGESVGRINGDGSKKQKQTIKIKYKYIFLNNKIKSISMVMGEEGKKIRINQFMLDLIGSKITKQNFSQPLERLDCKTPPEFQDPKV